MLPPTARRLVRPFATVLVAFALVLPQGVALADPGSVAIENRVSALGAGADAGAKGSTYVVPTAARGRGGNPLAQRPWGVYQGKYELWYEPWIDSRGRQRKLLDKIALRPKAAWFGKWNDNHRIAGLLRDYIDTSQNDDPNALVQLAIFRMDPWYHNACKRSPTRAQKRSYKQWINIAARTVGSTPAAIIIQPDGPFALCTPNRRLTQRLVRFATKKFAALPNTSVYVEAGSADWVGDNVKKSLNILVPAGVKFARGFAFNGTHYDSTARNIRFGAKVRRALAKRGIRGKNFVINTAQNGSPFRGFQYPKPQGCGPNNGPKACNYPDQARVCKNKRDRLCVTLGIPPTTHVASRRWGLGQRERRLARRYVDAYMWFGRPWLHRQNSPFEKRRALQMVRSSPFK